MGLLGVINTAILFILRKIIAVIHATFAVAKRKPQKHSCTDLYVQTCTGFESRTSLICFSRLSFNNCKSCMYMYNCDDRPSYNFFPPQFTYMISYIYNFKNNIILLTNTKIPFQKLTKDQYCIYDWSRLLRLLFISRVCLSLACIHQ